MARIAFLKRILLWLFFLFLALFLVLPFISLIVWSLTTLWPWPKLMPDSIDFASWRYLFSHSGKGMEGLINSFAIAALAVAGNFVIGLPAARVLAQKKFFGKSFVFAILLSPLFFPLTVSVMGMHELAVTFGFLNEYVHVAVAHILITLPYFIAMVSYQYKLMGTKLQEAALSLGASRWKVFLWIELPQIVPALLLASLFVIIISFSQYLPTWIMSGGTLLTLPLIIFPFASSGNATMVSVYSLWFLLPITLLVLLYFLILTWLQNRKQVVRP